MKCMVIVHCSSGYIRIKFRECCHIFLDPIWIDGHGLIINRITKERSGIEMLKFNIHWVTSALSLKFRDHLSWRFDRDVWLLIFDEKRFFFVGFAGSNQLAGIRWINKHVITRLKHHHPLIPAQPSPLNFHHWSLHRCVSRNPNGIPLYRLTLGRYACGGYRPPTKCFPAKFASCYHP